jgi:hypothetical protein
MIAQSKVSEFETELPASCFLINPGLLVLQYCFPLTVWASAIKFDINTPKSGITSGFHGAFLYLMKRLK